MSQSFSNMVRRYVPILTWGAEYSRQTLANDLVAATIVTIMLIPQSLAYALLVGLMLIAMGVLRLGFLANFLSHPVISGFISAAAVQISAGQRGPLLGIKVHGESGKR